MFAAASPILAVITVITTLPLVWVLNLAGVRWSLMAAVACTLVAFVGIVILAPTLAFVRTRIGTRLQGALRIARSALAGALLATYTIWAMGAITAQPQPDMGRMPPAGTELAGIVVLSVGLALSKSLSAVQIIAYAFGCVGGGLWGLVIVVQDFDAIFGWTLWGAATGLLMAVARKIRRP